MFENVQDAMDWVMSQRKSHTFNEFKQYMALKGDPQKKLKCIHVAGTNGKGSTTNYLRSILQHAGYKVGSFTSPHLMTHLDRIRINDVNIDEKYFLDIVNEHYDEWVKYELSMFEIDMYISVCYFLKEKVDIVVYEVGLGGRLDNTNVILPMVSVITNIEMDHMKILGDTIEKIAYEKAGIIKDDTDIITFEKKKEALDVFKKQCELHHSKLILTDEIVDYEVKDDKLYFTYHDHRVVLNTIASYQVLNASLAIETIDYLNSKGLIHVSEQQLLDGLYDTFWAGRFEKVSDDPLVYIDGAHNENGIDALCKCIDELGKEVVIVFSALKDKEYHSMLKKLLSKGEVIVTQFENRRMGSAEELADGFSNVTIVDDYKQALQLGLSKGKTMIVTGSLYFISLVRFYFINGKK